MPAYDASQFNPPAPLAQVTLRNPERNTELAGVAMLVDSGADVTLVPRSAVQMLGVDIVAERSYELMGFDGNISVATPVELDLVFLKRVFRGQFLIIDQESGILGRDVLNHLALLFDGPQLTWSEHR
jgi:hypothetical protein